MCARPTKPKPTHTHTRIKRTILNKTKRKKNIEKNLYLNMCDHPVDCRRIVCSRLLWFQSNIVRLECKRAETVQTHSHQPKAAHLHFLC